MVATAPMMADQHERRNLEMRRSPKEIAVDIFNGAKAEMEELEKMFGLPFEKMTVEQRRLGVALLSAKEELLQK